MADDSESEAGVISETANEVVNKDEIEKRIEGYKKRQGPVRKILLVDVVVLGLVVLIVLVASNGTNESTGIWKFLGWALLITLPVLFVALGINSNLSTKIKEAEEKIGIEHPEIQRVPLSESLKPTHSPPTILTTCKVCGKDVSRLAPNCPHCGEAYPGIKNTCPRCGSMSFQINKKGFGVGKAAAGVLLIGAIGAVGGMIGAKDVEMSCVQCSYRWTPTQQDFM